MCAAKSVLLAECLSVGTPPPQQKLLIGLLLAAFDQDALRHTPHFLFVPPVLRVKAQVMKQQNFQPNWKTLCSATGNFRLSRAAVSEVPQMISAVGCDQEESLDFEIKE